ncbi:UPF0687 protein C20orf27 homolog [Gracilinanus agilis]|uniref:UPF0687 protein C20orf27 homolog n=1 Tax=Gracilinanus agilis TaxID=191870 RepID=UPI001CFDE04B|nr:UPF0687 protein C20orf27 homolog [Gracilinanus agilis]
MDEKRLKKASRAQEDGGGCRAWEGKHEEEEEEERRPAGARGVLGRPGWGGQAWPASRAELRVCPSPSGHFQAEAGTSRDGRPAHEGVHRRMKEHLSSTDRGLMGDSQIGFLKVMHKYEVTFTLPPLPRLGRDVCAVPTPSLHLKVLSITPVPEGFCVKCEYIAHKEGVLKEELVLACETNDSVSVRVVLQARVMDRHHGTPMLLDGVRCMGAELEYDSEQSDWRGFD